MKEESFGEKAQTGVNFQGTWRREIGPELAASFYRNH